MLTGSQWGSGIAEVLESPAEFFGNAQKGTEPYTNQSFRYLLINSSHDGLLRAFCLTKPVLETQGGGGTQL